MQLSMFLIMPNILLSGYMFPVEAMPKSIQGISQFLPLTHFIKVLRGIILKGIGFSSLKNEFLILSLFAIAILSFATFKFEKKVD